jgi:hypothetical protein
MKSRWALFDFCFSIRNENSFHAIEVCTVKIKEDCCVRIPIDENIHPEDDISYSVYGWLYDKEPEWIADFGAFKEACDLAKKITGKK